MKRKKVIVRQKWVGWILNGFIGFRYAQWINVGGAARCTWPYSLFILLAYYVTDLIMRSCCIYADRTAGVWFWNGHRTRATDLALIILGATPKYSLFTFSISDITIVVQHQYRIAPWRCLIRYIHTSYN